MFQPLMSDASVTREGRLWKAGVVSLLIGLGCTVMWLQISGQAADDGATNLISAVSMPASSRMMTAEALASRAAAANLRGLPPSARSALISQVYAPALQFAARDGARVGCRGSLQCVRAVGVFFGTQTGKTEDVAGKIAAEAGAEAKDIGDISAGDLAGFDGLIVGAPTWHTGADEQRSGTAWDDYLEEIRALDLCGKPVAVFGTGDSAGYGDNFCDAIDELHATFAAAGAKMIGYTDASGYEHSDSKSDQDGKFVGLPLDEDNEDDKTEDRVKAWVTQLKGEGMPI